MRPLLVATIKRPPNAPSTRTFLPRGERDEFCARQPDECVGTTRAPQDIALSPEAWMELVHVNKWVLKSVAYV
ncbi:MAG: transglutaminase-like cysteine peptidase [Xanthobacteraceae bacterium]